MEEDTSHNKGEGIPNLYLTNTNQLYSNLNLQTLTNQFQDLPNLTDPLLLQNANNVAAQSQLLQLQAQNDFDPLPNLLASAQATADQQNVATQQMNLLNNVQNTTNILNQSFDNVSSMTGINESVTNSLLDSSLLVGTGQSTGLGPPDSKKSKLDETTFLLSNVAASNQFDLVSPSVNSITNIDLQHASNFHNNLHNNFNHQNTSNHVNNQVIQNQNLNLLTNSMVAQGLDNLAGVQNSTTDLENFLLQDKQTNNIQIDHHQPTAQIFTEPTFHEPIHTTQANHMQPLDCSNIQNVQNVVDNNFDKRSTCRESIASTDLSVVSSQMLANQQNLPANYQSSPMIQTAFTNQSNQPVYIPVIPTASPGLYTNNNHNSFGITPSSSAANNFMNLNNQQSVSSNTEILQIPVSIPNAPPSNHSFRSHYSHTGTRSVASRNSQTYFSQNTNQENESTNVEINDNRSIASSSRVSFSKKLNNVNDNGPLIFNASWKKNNNNNETSSKNTSIHERELSPYPTPNSRITPINQITAPTKPIYQFRPIRHSDKVKSKRIREEEQQRQSQGQKDFIENQENENSSEREDVIEESMEDSETNIPITPTKKHHGSHHGKDVRFFNDFHTGSIDFDDNDIDNELEQELDNVEIEKLDEEEEMTGKNILRQSQENFQRGRKNLDKIPHSSKSSESKPRRKYPNQKNIVHEEIGTSSGSEPEDTEAENSENENDSNIASTENENDSDDSFSYSNQPMSPITKPYGKPYIRMPNINAPLIEKREERAVKAAKEEKLRLEAKKLRTEAENCVQQNKSTKSFSDFSGPLTNTTKSASYDGVQTKDREKDLLDDLDHLEKNILSDNDDEENNNNNQNTSNTSRPSPAKLERKFSKTSILPLTPKKSSVKKSSDSSIDTKNENEDLKKDLSSQIENTAAVQSKTNESVRPTEKPEKIDPPEDNLKDQIVKIGTSEYKIVETKKFSNKQHDPNLLTQTLGYTTKNKPNSRAKLYICSYCQKSFNKKWDVERHVRYIHTKVKPYKCETCHKCFAEPGALNKHAKRHVVAGK